MKLKNSKKEQKQILKIIKKTTGFSYDWGRIEEFYNNTSMSEINLLSKNLQDFLIINFDNDAVVKINHLPISSRIPLWRKKEK